LAQLVESGSVTPGDSIYFRFKRNTFTAQFSDGGILYNCMWKDTDGKQTKVFNQKTFTTLSDWTESCIQELLKEYSTRYSSWKRVTHAKTDMTLDEMWKNHMEKRLNGVKKPTVTQLKQMNERLLEKLAMANEKIQDLTTENATMQSVHPIVMDSPHGTYMILQRMIDTENPVVADVKNMGMDEFRRHLKEFSSTQKVIETHRPDEWFTKLRMEKTSDHDIANFVYRFFHGKKRRHGHVQDNRQTKRSSLL